MLQGHSSSPHVLNIALSWRPCGDHLHLVDVVRFTDPELNFVDSENRSDRQTW